MSADDLSRWLYTLPMHKIVQMVPAKVALAMFNTSYASTRISDNARSTFFARFRRTRELNRGIARRISTENMWGGFNSSVMGNPAFNAIVAHKKQDPKTW